MLVGRGPGMSMATESKVVVAGESFMGLIPFKKQATLFTRRALMDRRGDVGRHLGSILDAPQPVVQAHLSGISSKRVVSVPI